MPDSSNTPELYERVVKIKELPMKESVTPDSVLLIEDDEDTKQMSVKAFYDLIDNMSKQALDMVRTKIEELNSYIENSGIDGIAELIKQIEEAEKARVEAEKEREANEQDRESTFNGWKNTFEKTWTNKITQWEKQEVVRQSNEQYRTNLFNQWLQMINQWELAEQDRVEAETEREEAEDARETAEDTRRDNEIDRTTEFNNSITTINNKITEMTNTQTTLINTVNKAIEDMNNRLDEIMKQIEAGLKVEVPVGTTLFSTSSSTSFFDICFGGSWEIIGNLDAIVGTNSTLTLYLFRKISDT